MAKREDIKSILIIGAGPIVIGQACEFDYSGVQACKTLKEEGYKVILVNSNPATIMTDPNFADKTYIEPIDWQTVEKIIEKERPDAILPTMGGQTALNCALDLHAKGVLEKYNVEMIGARPEAIDKAENRRLFQEAMRNINLDIARGSIAHNMEEAQLILEDIGLPLIIRPSFTLGGTGGGVAYNQEEFEAICRRGLDASPTNELLVEESIIGWKEFEMEVVRDKADNCIIVCAIENVDPMGVHTGDSITVAPAQTLTDKEYQIMRNASIAVLREIGVDTGGSNVQFAVNPDDGRIIVIEMNPRVSRSSALASKATGFPIAKVAAKLAVGYTLDEVQNDITGGKTPASFEPSIDYVVTKIPRFDFEKFPLADSTLTSQMKSVGEVMAIGRTFKESLQKAMRSLEIGNYGFESVMDLENPDMEELKYRLSTPKQDRLWFVGDAFRLGMSIDEVFNLCYIDRWFLAQIETIIRTEKTIQSSSIDAVDKDTLFSWKQMGFSDVRLAALWHCQENDVRKKRHDLGVRPIFKRVDSCAAEFSTSTAYMYSSYDEECESNPVEARKIVVLGGGPNRIGQGIEFDYCCVHASLAMRQEGYQSIMINCNPETVSTDYDTSDRLYFEPLTLEDVLEVLHKENPEGVIVQYGGQTPLKLARSLEAAGMPIIGTSPTAIHQAEDREFFQAFLNDLGLKQPPNRTAGNAEDALRLAEEIGYPLVVRPSYVLGGRAMEIVHFPDELENYMRKAVQVSNDSPVLLDRFLSDAIEVDVDAVSDGKQVVIGGIMQHIEEAGIHSGDSACSLPPYSLPKAVQDEIRAQTVAMALKLNVIGLMNVQFAVKGDDIYVLEVNPRASRTVPFVSKATSVLLAQVGARCMVGQSLESQGFTKEIIPPFYNVKEAVFPFAKFPGVDTILGPEMRSTGEVMGIGETFGEAFAKAVRAASMPIPEKGMVLVSVKDADKPQIVELCKYLCSQGFTVSATGGTANALEAAGIEVTRVNKVNEGRPHIIDMIKDKKASLVINTTEGKQSLKDSYVIRREALNAKVTYFTTVAGAWAAGEAHKQINDTSVNSIQSLHERIV